MAVKVAVFGMDNYGFISVLHYPSQSSGNFIWGDAITSVFNPRSCQIAAFVMMGCYQS